MVVGETTALVGDNAVIGVLGGVLWYGDPEGRSYLHALEYKIHAVGILPLRPAAPASNIVLPAYALLRPLDRDSTIAGEGLHPALVVVRPLT